MLLLKVGAGPVKQAETSSDATQFANTQCNSFECRGKNKSGRGARPRTTYSHQRGQATLPDLFLPIASEETHVFRTLNFTHLDIQFCRCCNRCFGGVRVTIDELVYDWNTIDPSLTAPNRHIGI